MVNEYSEKVVVCSIVFPTVACFVVAARFYCRHTLNNKLRSNDYLALAALVCAVALCINFLSAAIHAGLGDDMSKFTLEQYSEFNKYIYAGVICAYLSFGIVKLSVLEFYKSIFDVQKFRQVANVFLCVIGTWTVVNLFLAIFSAWPISNFWTLGASYAFNHPKWLFYSTILDTTFDLLILCLPFPMIWNMIGLDTQRKLQLTFIFMTGFFCVIAAGLRIYYGWRLSGTGQNTAGQVSNEEMPSIVYNNVIWCEMEACFSVIAACLPCIGSFLTRIVSGAVKLANSIVARSKSLAISKAFSSKGHSKGSVNSGSGSDDDIGKSLNRRSTTKEEPIDGAPARYYVMEEYK
ncbi:hypothetical protein BS50DRAFT_681647 [Corynespora cassiicola Philippines]|uniref:Rhodopsin domain-containing protein n=1 Tax=Corynespora cassiicola Philippines TaxID=1448308 RepID=A0A2T2N4X4_CORCC|nr:hypothetical protein BS50DRAFT_681647 [Corynespora cassiicola Philippines]